MLIYIVITVCIICCHSIKEKYMNPEKKPKGRPKGIHTPIKYFTQELKRGKTLYGNPKRDNGE